MPLYDSFVIAIWDRQELGATVYNDGIAHYGSSLITYLVSIKVLVLELANPLLLPHAPSGLRLSLEMKNYEEHTSSLHLDFWLDYA